MARNDTPTRGSSVWEFSLVVIMLGVLLVLVILVLRLNPHPAGFQVEGMKEFTYKDLLEWRKDILSIILTAFGAWIGAGAAYFFGRENLRVATSSLLAMREVSPRERLRRTTIKQIPPAALDWTVKKDTLIGEIKDKLIKDPGRWFVPIVKDDGSLDTVMNEEAVWRYLIDASHPQDSQVQDILKSLEENEELKKFKDIHIVVTMETTVGAANDLMDSRNIFLSIVESGGKPTHYFTTTEVRKLLLKSGEGE